MRPKQPKLISVRKIICLYLLMLCIASLFIVKGQVQKTATKVLEYQRTSFDLSKANLDDTAVQFQKAQNTRLYVITYGKPDKVFWSSRKVKRYLVHGRGLISDRVVTIEGGEEKILRFEHWFVPDGAEPPVPTSLSKFPPVNEVYRLGAFYLSEDETLEDWKYQVFAEYLNKQPESVGYIVGYWEKKNKFLREFTNGRKLLVNEYGIPRTSVKTWYGGYSGNEKLEFWIVPKDKPFRLPQR